MDKLEMRWLHDTFDKPDEISENALLVQCMRDGRAIHQPLILQFRSGGLWQDVKYQNPDKELP